MATRTFTIEEANRVLPEVRALAAHLAELLSRLPELQEAVATADYRRRRPGAERDGDLPEEAYQAARAAVVDAEAGLAATLSELDALGIQIKDPIAGLLDFPSLRDGELVELCWMLGEGSILHWHRIGEGFAGRKPI
ncbi:MAG: DUF2203 domain-containing protein [Candidatus Dormibacteraceae bacterium]